MVARLTPDQKVACSIHVGFNALTAAYLFRFLKSVIGVLSASLRFELHNSVTVRGRDDPRLHSPLANTGISWRFWGLRLAPGVFPWTSVITRSLNPDLLVF